MAVEVRSITAGEVDDLARTLFTAFGEEATADKLEDERTWAEPDRLLGAVEDGRFVGSAGAYSFDLTLPGLATVPVAGVTWVGVLPTHRRRGILNEMMRFQLDDIADRGEAVAVLTASEAAIYGRFGYGLASRLARATVVSRGEAAFLSAPDAPGRLRMIDGDEQAAVRPKVYDNVRRRRVGELSRPDAWWTMNLRDREYWRDGASHRFCVVHEDDGGNADGYVAYRVKEVWDDDGPNSEVVVADFAATDSEVEAALWRYLLDIDLTAKVSAHHRPLADPIALRLADWRRYRVTRVVDHLWARVLDVPAALSARRYEQPGTVVVSVDDPFRPSVSGRYRVEGGPDEAACERLDGDGPADIELGAAALGSLLLGDVAPSLLAEAGRLRPASPAALETADRLFPTRRAPHCTMTF